MGSDPRSVPGYLPFVVVDSASAKSWLRLTMNIVPLAGTGVE
jgi:hypothetical protein